MEVVLTDLTPRAVAFLTDYRKITVTPRLNSYAEVAVALEPGDPSAAELAVARRALQVYDGENLRFFGKVWEPLVRGDSVIEVTARDPWAEFAQRRARTGIEGIAGEDAGDILINRVGAQNLLRQTYLRALTTDRDLSVNRSRTIIAGQLESEIALELAEAADGFFFRVIPDNSLDVGFGRLRILYPDAGVTREEVRFEYGEHTLDNLVGYKITSFLPRNRWTVASSAATGGRIAKVAQRSASVEEYGLFEDETAYSDVSDETLLQEQADASVVDSPPEVVEITPGRNAPLVFEAFDVGDFVRLRIRDGSFNVFEWVRVLEAALTAEQNGVKYLSGLVVERLPGSRQSENPERLFRRQLDDTRRRIEALERRVTNQEQVASAPPDAPDPSGGFTPTPPPEPTEPPPPPPPPPPTPPQFTLFIAQGQNVRENGVLRRGGHMGASFDTKGLPANLYFLVYDSAGTTLVHISPVIQVSGVGSRDFFQSTGVGSFQAQASLTTSAGQTLSSKVPFSVPAVTAE